MVWRGAHGFTPKLSHAMTQMLYQKKNRLHLITLVKKKQHFCLLPEEKQQIYAHLDMLIPNMQTEFLYHFRILSYMTETVNANHQTQLLY